MLCGEQAVRDKYSSCQRRLIWSMSPQTHQSVMLALDLSFSVCFFPVGEFARPISTTAKPQLSYQLSSYCKLRTEALCPFISNTSLAQILFPHQNQTLGAGTRVLHSHPEISLPCWLLALHLHEATLQLWPTGTKPSTQGHSDNSTSMSFYDEVAVCYISVLVET